MVRFPLRPPGRSQPPSGSGDPSGKRVGLVLAGGGIPGWMYEVGCLTALDEFFCDGFSSNRFDLYVGTSCGAAVASLLANGVAPRTIYDAIANDADSPFNFNRRDIYQFGTGETMAMIRRMLAAGGAMAGATLRGLFGRGPRPSLLDLLSASQEALPSGLFTLHPLRKNLAEIFAAAERTDDFRELTPELYIPAVDLDRGEYVVFGEEGADDIPISLATVASSSVPVLFQPVRIGDRDFIDGGVGRVANMRVAVDHGADLVVVVNPVVHLENDRKTVCLPTCHGLCRGLRDKGMAYVADQAMRINTGMRLRSAKAQQQARNPDLDVMIFEPSSNDALMFVQPTMGQQDRHPVMRHGYRSTVAYLAQNFSDLEARFGRVGISVTLSRFRHRQQSTGWRILGPNERNRVNGAQPVQATDAAPVAVAPSGPGVGTS